MLSPGAIPLQPSCCSVLGQVLLGRAQVTDAFAGCTTMSLGD